MPDNSDRDISNRPDRELFLDGSNRGWRTPHDLGSEISRAYIVMPSAERIAMITDLDALATVEGDRCACHDPDNLRDEPLPECPWCSGSGTVDTDTSEIADDIERDLRVLMCSRWGNADVPRDPDAFQVFLDIFRQYGHGPTSMALVEAHALVMSCGAAVQPLAYALGELSGHAREAACEAIGAWIGRLEFTDGDVWLVPEDMSYCDLAQEYFWAWPMVVRLENSEDALDDGTPTVTIYCDSPAQARLDQSIDGCSWECPRDMDVAYASTIDRPDLVADFRAQGYVVDDDAYAWSWPEVPSAEEIARRADVEVSCEPEEIPVRGNASAWGTPDDEVLATEIESRLADGDTWAWCTVGVTVTLEWLGETHVATEYLGGCSYEDEQAFRRCDYFADMRRAACEAIRGRIARQIAAARAAHESRIAAAA